MVEQQPRYPVGAEDLMGHDREQHRRGQERTDDHATGQVGDLRSALSHVRGLRLRRAGAAVGRRRRAVIGSTAVPVLVSSAGSTTRVPWTMFMPQAKPNVPARSGRSRTVVLVCAGGRR